MQLRASEAASRILMGFAKPKKSAIFADLGMSVHFFFNLRVFIKE